MEWLNIHIAKQLRSPEAIGSAPAELGTWLRVLAYCCEQENGGRIVGGALWKDRQWQQLCAVTIRELREADRLIRFDGNDIVVNGYPNEKEAQVQRGRRRAQAGAMARWGKRNSTCSSICSSNAQASAQAHAEGEGEGEEEGEGARHAQASAAPPRRTYPWIRTAARDPSRQADNEAALQALENKYGPPLVARAAETVALRKGGKLYPDDKDLLAELYRISDEGWPKPEVDPHELVHLTKAEIARHEARQAERRAKGLPTTELAIVRFTDPPAPAPAAAAVGDEEPPI